MNLSFLADIASKNATIAEAMQEFFSLSQPKISAFILYILGAYWYSKAVQV